MAPCTQLRDSYRSYGSVHPAPASDDPAVLWVACAAAARKTWSMEIVVRAAWKNKCLGWHVQYGELELMFGWCSVQYRVKVPPCRYLRLHVRKWVARAESGLHVLEVGCTCTFRNWVARAVLGCTRRKMKRSECGNTDIESTGTGIQYRQRN